MVKNQVVHTSKPKSRPEFSKCVVMSMMAISCGWVSLSFVLSWFGKETLEGLTETIVTTLLASIVGYFAKAFFEKNSRNKYGLDADGNPLAGKEATPEKEEQNSTNEV